MWARRDSGSVKRSVAVSAQRLQLDTQAVASGFRTATLLFSGMMPFGISPFQLPPPLPPLRPVRACVAVRLPVNCIHRPIRMYMVLGKPNKLHVLSMCHSLSVFCRSSFARWRYLVENAQGASLPLSFPSFSFSRSRQNGMRGGNVWFDLLPSTFPRSSRSLCLMRSKLSSARVSLRSRSPSRRGGRGGVCVCVT